MKNTINSPNNCCSWGFVTYSRLWGCHKEALRSQLVIVNKFYERERIELVNFCETEGWQKRIG
jgi:hypothetical protein